MITFLRMTLDTSSVTFNSTRLGNHLHTSNRIVAGLDSFSNLESQGNVPNLATHTHKSLITSDNSYSVVSAVREICEKIVTRCELYDQLCT